MDFKLDPITGDLDITNGLSLVNDLPEKAQYIRLGLNLNLGEWFLDIERGVPWLFNPEEKGLPSNIQYLLGDESTNSYQFITKQIRRYIEKQTFVDRVELVDKFTPSTKTYELTGTIYTNDGEVLELIPYIQEF